MNDYALTEKAARAAGLDFHSIKDDGERVVCVLTEQTEDWVEYCGWTPLTDDGDALFLAARMGIVVQDTEKGCIATCIDIPGTEGRGYLVGSDRYAARRFAIVQCAASSLSEVESC